jgi:hypothetical protein
MTNLLKNFLFPRMNSPSFEPDPENPPALDRERRKNVLSVTEINAFAERIPGSIPPARRRVLEGFLYLWNDHWQEAHEIAQEDEGEPDHDLLHALAHRREGDFSNAGYWFRRAGKASAYANLPARVSPLLTGSPLAAKVLPGGAWSAAGFLEAVRRNEQPGLLRALQAQEFLAFRESLLS